MHEAMYVCEESKRQMGRWWQNMLMAPAPFEFASTRRSNDKCIRVVEVFQIKCTFTKALLCSCSCAFLLRAVRQLHKV